MKKIDPLIQWWVTPKLPANDITAKHNPISKWITHPGKRRIAKWYLQFLKNNTDIKVIGITGSAGKTTTKEMLAAILRLDGKTIYTPKNVDSVYSIPNTILRTPIGTKYLVLEMGVEYPGEMDFYLWLAKPNIVIITNIFPTHLEFLGDIEGVFKEKSKLVLSLPSDGIAVLNSGDAKLKSISKNLKARVVWFNPDKNPIDQNANAASAAARSLGIPEDIIKNGLSNYQRPEHRLHFIKHKSGAVILDDSYNSNPWAALATLEYFNSIAKGKKVAILGDMLELGNYDETAHRELGLAVAKSNFEVVIAVGKSSKFLIEEVNKLSKNTKTYLFSATEEAFPVASKLLNKDTTLLVKGSHSIGLDKLVAKL